VDVLTECLRPLTEVFTTPYKYATPQYPITTQFATHHAFVGHIEKASLHDLNSATDPGSVPNAFLASSPNHPIWLFPISEVLRRFVVDQVGHVRRKPAIGTPKEITGPPALERGIVAYHYWILHRHLDPFVPALSRLVKLAPDIHDLVILNEPIIYPFSWTETNAEVWEGCKAGGNEAFDSRKCHGE
jgi:hypothetical protein